MAEEHEHDYSLVSDEAFQRSEDRQRGQSGEQHPLRRQFEGFAESRTDLSGTPAYGRNWLQVRDTGVSRFRGRTSAKERERAAYGAGRGFAINMTTHNYPGSVNSTNYGGTTHNYGLSGMEPVAGGPDAPWSGPTAAAPAVSFASPQAPAEPTMWGDVKEMAGGVARAAVGGVVRGVANRVEQRRGAKAKGSQFDNTPAVPGPFDDLPF